MTASTDNKTKKQIELTFEVADINANNGIPIITKAASVFVDNKGIDQSFSTIKVVVKDSLDLYDITYNINDVKDVNSSLNVINSFLKYSQSDKHEDIITIIDTLVIPDSSLRQILKIMSDVDSSYGSISKIKILKYQISKVTATSEPIILFWIDIENNNAICHYTFITYKNKKRINYIGINDNNYQLR